MFQRLKIVVMLGGPSAEREVSLRSGAGVVKALRSLGHTVVELDPKTPDWILPPDTEVVCLAPLHGTYGEDGTVQRQLAQLGVLYTGCDSEASRIAFDKVLTKQKCISAGVPTAKFVVVNSEKAPLPKDLQLPLVVKPVRQGSSVGLQFVERAEDWQNALAEALKFWSRKKSSGARRRWEFWTARRCRLWKSVRRLAVTITKINIRREIRNIFARRILIRRRLKKFKLPRLARFTQSADAITRAWT
jgi:hypothetical protein